MKIFNPCRKEHAARAARLKKILRVANNIAESNPDALRDFVKLLGGKLQHDYMCRALSQLNEHKVPDLEPKTVWFDPFAHLDSTGCSLSSLKQEVSEKRFLQLSSDLIMPWPWNMSRIETCISKIGAGRPAGEWKQDYRNHSVEYWLPFGIGWVLGGNHSITSGIVQGVGEIEVTKVYDLSPAFSYIEFDGTSFNCIKQQHVLERASEFEFAAIFEVGKIMHRYGVSA